MDLLAPPDCELTRLIGSGETGCRSCPIQVLPKHTSLWVEEHEMQLVDSLVVEKVDQEWLTGTFLLNILFYLTIPARIK